MAVELSGYGIAQQRAAAELAPSSDDTGLREKALAMAIDYHRSSHGDRSPSPDVDSISVTATKFLAFLKGGANV